MSRRPLLPAAAAVALAPLLFACPRPPMPKGPPPEYEEPAEPAWFQDAGAQPVLAPTEPPPATSPAPPPAEPAPEGDAGAPDA